MGRFFTFIVVLGLLAGGGMWLKKHYQQFVKQGIDKNALRPQQNDPQPRNRQEPEDETNDLTDVGRGRPKKIRGNENDETDRSSAMSNAKASPTNAPNAQRVKRGEDKYEFTYIFRDPKEKGVQFTWTGDKKLHDQLPRKFGLPKDFFQGGRYTQEQVDALQRKGSFRQATIDGKQFTVPDYNKIARDNRPITAPIYKAIKQYLGKACTPTKLIETLMVFCQDIPYKRPPAARGKRYIGELDVPAKMLTVGTGDCDTKSVFFASTLLHQPSIKVAVVLVDNPSHMFAAVRGVPTPYQAFVEHQGEKYIVCEPVGNARLPVGQLGFKECRTKLIVKINP